MPEWASVDVLLVDDGSTDGTADVARGYAARHAFMAYMRKENGGVSTVRNFGLHRAAGRFVWFVDGDDELAGGVIGKLLPCLGDIDAQMVTCDFVISEDGEEIVCRKGGKLPAERPVTGIDYLSVLWTGAVWEHIYCRRFLLENGLLFKEGLVHEDNEFDIRVFGTVRRIIYQGVVAYKYHKDNARVSLSKVKSLRDTCSVFPLIDSCRSMEQATVSGIIAYHGRLL